MAEVKRPERVTQYVVVMTMAATPEVVGPFMGQRAADAWAVGHQIAGWASVPLCSPRDPDGGVS